MKQAIARFFLRSARGQGLVSKGLDPVRDVLEGTVYLFALKGLLNVSIPFYGLILIVAAKKGIEVMLGYLDERWGFWKAENWYQSYMLDPYNQEVMERLKRIEENITSLEEYKGHHQKNI